MTNPYTELFNGKQPLILRRPFLLPNGYHAEPLLVYRALAIEWLARGCRAGVARGDRQGPGRPCRDREAGVNINVPQWAEAEFWDEPPDGAWEFWSFRFPPPCKVGDPLVFKMRGVVVARAVCAAIEPPGVSKCERSGRFKRGYKVFWAPESFVEDADGRALVKGAP